jgi:PDZ domain-containing protein
VVKRLTPGRVLTTGLVLLGLVLAILYLAPSSNYIFLPDPAHPVAPLVSVPGHPRPRTPGKVYYVDVVVRKATLLEQLFPGIRDGATLHSVKSVNQGLSDNQLERLNTALMQESQTTAAAVAERAFGLAGVRRPPGVVVVALEPGAPAARKLRRNDVIRAVDRKPVRTLIDLARFVGAHRPGDRVTLTVRRARRMLSVPVQTIRSSDSPHRTIIGFQPGQLPIHLPVEVRIDARGVGGPSAGLAFALQVMQSLGRNVLRGHRVAATGEISLDGTVSPIGGVKQKTLGAREAKVDVFLVPAGDNAREARRYAGGLKVVPVHNFRQALRALATLPPAAEKA